MSTHDDPTSCVRDFFRAMALGDRALLMASTLPLEGREVLLRQPWRSKGLPALDSELRDLQVGVRSGDERRRIAHAWFRGTVHPLAVENTPEGWRVDARYQVSAAAPSLPEHETARRFLYAMVTGQRDLLEELVVDVRGLEVLLGSAPPSGEWGQYEHVCEMLPLYEVKLGERFPDLLGGTETYEQKHVDHGIRVFVGIFDAVEVPFLVRRIDGRCKVSAFHFIRAALKARGAKPL